MLNLVLLLTAAALVALQNNSSSAHIITNGKIDLDNSLQPNVVPQPKRKVPRKFLNIEGPPPETVGLSPNELLVITCGVIASPAPTLRWLKNGEPLLNYDDESNEIQYSPVTSLGRLKSTLVTEAAPGDVFTCLASNEVKNDVASTVAYPALDSEPELQFLPMTTSSLKPHIILHYTALFQDIGSDAVLYCHVLFPQDKGEIFWEDNSGELVQGNLRLRVLPSGDLLIRSLRWTDMGGYKCTAENSYGKETISTFLYPTKVK